MEILIENPVLLLFLIAGAGYALGQIKIMGFNMGVAAILFAGLAVGAFFPGLKLPESFYRLGLVLFVYTVGISSGPSFFASFKRKGFRDNLFIMLILLCSGFFAIIFALFFKIRGTYIAGMFAGSLTNTPALAGILEYLKELGKINPQLSKTLSEPVVAYAVTYPGGVIGMILAIYLTQRLWKIDYRTEKTDSYAPGLLTDKIMTVTVKITNTVIAGKTVNNLVSENKWNIVFGRIKADEKLSLADEHTVFNSGDLVSITGPENEILRIAGILGEISEEKLELDRHFFDFRRIFVSNHKVMGKRVAELGLNKFGAIITRIRRGDVDFIASPDSVLEPGDRVRVVAPLKNMDSVSRFFGDSFKKLSEVDVISFSLGIALGLILGSIPIPLYEGTEFKLGFAGGPLIVGLILGKLEKTGPLLWQIPYNANLTLRQFGMILFLAGIGISSGAQLVTIFSEATGLYIFLGGLFITLFSAMATLWVGFRIMKIPMGILVGILAGLQTQPAVLAFANEQTGNDLPNIGYATVFPFAMILKIMIAQILVMYLL